MSDTFVVRPREGLIVRDPETHALLRADGERKPRSRYWLRRVNEGSCVVVDSIASTRDDEES